MSDQYISAVKNNTHWVNSDREFKENSNHEAFSRSDWAYNPYFLFNQTLKATHFASVWHTYK